MTPFINDRFRSADLFTLELVRQYQRRTAVERDTDMNWSHAARFAAKGRRAMDEGGLTVEPDLPERVNVAGEDLADLQSARDELMARLERGRRLTPEACARAQVYFDGWLEQAHDNDYGPGFHGPVQPDFVAAERAAFEEILPECDDRFGRPEPEPVLPPSTEKRFRIYFGWNSDRITAQASAVLESIADFVTGIAGASLELEGHTDRSGSELYNSGLSERRARAVREALEARDAVVSGMTWFGERDPAIPTPDGVRESDNRRVEVFVVRPEDR